MPFSLFASRRATRRQPVPFTPPRFRPSLDGFEDRVVPSAPPLAPAQAAPAQAAPTFNLGLLHLNIGNVQIVNANGVNTLVGTASIGNVTTPVPIDLTASPNALDPTTPILNLHLGPIHLDLLGLQVDTSQICLDVTAHSGPGNLLGNLLTDVANLLNGGTPLSDILGGLTAVSPTALTSGLNQLLGGVVGSLSTADVTGVSPSAAPGTTNILHLSLGPVDLNLLGLEVSLDNCAGGPVTVDITAESGPGRLLGNLLGGLSHLLDSNANGIAVGNLINRIEGEIGSLLGGL